MPGPAAPAGPYRFSARKYPPLRFRSETRTVPSLATSADVNTAAVLARVSVEGEELRDEIWEAGYSDLYDFFVPGNNPVAFFEATDTTPERATASGYAVARVFIEEMIRQQLLFGADVDALGSAELVRLSPPLSDGSDALVQRVAFLGVAGVVAVLAAIAFDGGAS